MAQHEQASSGVGQAVRALPKSKNSPTRESPALRLPYDAEKVSTREYRHVRAFATMPKELTTMPKETYLCTIIERLTRWPEAGTMEDSKSMSCTRAFMHCWVSRFLVSVDVTSDRGSQFTSSFWRDLDNIPGVRLHRTTAYHPQSNAIVERFHRHLKSSLMSELKGPNWSDLLPGVLTGNKNGIRRRS